MIASKTRASRYINTDTYWLSRLSLNWFMNRNWLLNWNLLLNNRSSPRWPRWPFSNRSISALIYIIKSFSEALFLTVAPARPSAPCLYWLLLCRSWLKSRFHRRRWIGYQKEYTVSTFIWLILTVCIFIIWHSRSTISRSSLRTSKATSTAAIITRRSSCWTRHWISASGSATPAWAYRQVWKLKF